MVATAQMESCTNLRHSPLNFDHHNDIKSSKPTKPTTAAEISILFANRPSFHASNTPCAFSRPTSAFPCTYLQYQLFLGQSGPLGKGSGTSEATGTPLLSAGFASDS